MGSFEGLRRVRDISVNRTSVLWDAEINIGSSGAPTIASGNGDSGISIARSGTGVYVLTFPRCYRASVWAQVLMTTPARHFLVVGDDLQTTSGENSTVTIAHLNADGNAADPASGDRLQVLIFARTRSV